MNENLHSDCSELLKVRDKVVCLMAPEKVEHETRLEELFIS